MRAPPPEVETALYDTEAQLATSLGNGRLQTPPGPARGALHGRHDLGLWRLRGGTLVEGHRDVAPEVRLDGHGSLGREPLFGTIEVRTKGHPALVDRSALAQA